MGGNRCRSLPCDTQFSLTEVLIRWVVLAAAHCEGTLGSAAPSITISPPIGERPGQRERREVSTPGDGFTEESCLCSGRCMMAETWPATLSLLESVLSLGAVPRQDGK